MIQVTTNIMCVNSKEMSQSMRHKNSPQTLFHHLINIANKKSVLLQLFQLCSLSQKMHICPRDSRFDSSHDGTTCSQHCVVNNLLIIGELPIDRERASDVTSVTAILASHIKQTY